MSIEITLEGLGHGALAEKFDDAIKDVVKNTTDPNTDATTKRKLVIELTFTPDKNDRATCKLETKVTTKLGATKPLESLVLMGFDKETGEIAAVEHAPQPKTLFDKSTQSMGQKPEPEIRESKVVGIRG